MHYYKRNIGDYAKKAGRLSMLQHGSYTLLIDACYDRERFPTMEEAIEWTWASTNDEIEAVQFVLRKFFVLENGVYVQTRIREELEEYRLMAETNKRIANERETNRKEKSTNRTPGVNEPPPNHKPITINQEPLIKKETRTRAPSFTKPTIDEVAEYCRERQNGISAESFMAFYESKGWVIGKSPMKNWKACITTWEKKTHETNQPIDNSAPARVKRENERRERERRERESRATDRSPY